MAATDILYGLLGTVKDLKPADARTAARTTQPDESNNWSQSRGHRAQGEDESAE